MTKLALVGGGGFAIEVYEIAKLRGYDVVGYFAFEQSSWDLPFLGVPERISDLRHGFDCIALAFGAVDRQSLTHRIDFARKLMAIAPIAPALVSPHAVVGGGVIMDRGAFVAHNVVLGPECHIGAFAVLNTAVSVGHHAKVGAGTILAPHAFIGGGTGIGDGCLIGPGVQVLQGIEIGSGVVAGVGVAVFRSLPAGTTVLPARMQVMKD